MNLIKEVVKSRYDIRDYTIKAGESFPKTFCLEVDVPVKNQGSKPTCVAHALSSAVEYHHKRQHQDYLEFSTEFIYGVREGGYYIGDGMCIRDGLKTIQKYGDTLECDCSGNHNYKTAMNNVRSNFEALKELAYPNRVSSYFRIKNAEGIKTALMKYGVVIVGMYTSGGKLVNDVFTYDKKSKGGAHCVFIYGWNEKGWLTQNSWGESYGGDGRFIIPFDYKFFEMWGVVDNITEGDLNKPKRNKVLDFIYLIINKLVNLFLTIKENAR